MHPARGGDNSCSHLGGWRAKSPPLSISDRWIRGVARVLLLGSGFSMPRLSSPLSLAFCLSIAACAASTTEPDSGPSAERAPLGKADAIGTCAGDDGEPSFCGGKSEGTCWCDELCEAFGDCCDDKAAVCDEEPPGPTECLNNGECADGDFCRFPAECGEGPVGTCDTIPDACIEIFSPVCGCDGVTYDNDCFAAGAGVSVQSTGACPEEPGADSCEGHCGSQSAGACWCDDACEGYGDCCEDYVEQCEEEPVDVCEGLVADFTAETEAIRSCEDDAECGQVLTGTSCGCTRNWVARNDADISNWESIREEAAEEGCSIGGISTCDCPPALGFRCDAGVCNWNYL